MNKSLQKSPIDRLLALMAQLRDPEHGCPWDLKQDFGTIAPHTIEEAYEVADAIDRQDMPALCDELGDLLFQVVFYAQMARERAAFDFNAIAEGIVEKMIRRHPHVFGDATIETAEAQTLAWEDHKAKERHIRAEAEGRLPSVLDGVTTALPPLTRALKLQNRAARVGFDWPAAVDVLSKIDEEMAEVRNEIAAGGDAERLSAEVGDLLFAAVNLARHLKVDPEGALRRANAKFERRFRGIENRLATAGRPVGEASLDEMEEAWTEVKRSETMR